MEHELGVLCKCPECGKIPNLADVPLENGSTHFKYFCGVHRVCGEWHLTEE